MRWVGNHRLQISTWTIVHMHYVREAYWKKHMPRRVLQGWQRLVENNKYRLRKSGDGASTMRIQQTSANFVLKCPPGSEASPLWAQESMFCPLLTRTNLGLSTSCALISVKQFGRPYHVIILHRLSFLIIDKLSSGITCESLNFSPPIWSSASKIAQSG